MLRLSRRKPTLPNLIVIGAMKSGTTSLHYYLDLHPEIRMSREKELNFFIEDRNWTRGVDWYASNFDDRARIRGESSPGYSNHPGFPGVPERIHGLIPETRLLYLVRDPIERMISHWIHNHASGREDRPIHEALLARDPNPYLNRSRYWMQLEGYLRYFPRMQLLVISFENLWSHRIDTLRRIFSFLEVDTEVRRRRWRIARHHTHRMRRKTPLGRMLASTAPARRLAQMPVRYRWPIQDLVYRPLSRRIARPELTGSIRKELAHRLAEDVRQLRKYTGHELRHWTL